MFGEYCFGGVQYGWSWPEKEGVSETNSIMAQMHDSVGPRAGSYSFVIHNINIHSLNRIGNLLVPNSNYCSFEDWVLPILDTLLAEQPSRETKCWTPSEVINRLGEEIGKLENGKESVYYWCWKGRVGF